MSPITEVTRLLGKSCLRITDALRLGAARCKLDLAANAVMGFRAQQLGPRTIALPAVGHLRGTFTRC